MSHSPTGRYFGIYDDNGLESVIPLEEASVGALQLRCRYNGHRNATMYAVELSDKEADELRNLEPQAAKAAVLARTAVKKPAAPQTLDF
jgi:hypothetical protein